MDVREKLEVIARLGDHITYKEEYGICYDSALAKVIEDAYMTLKNGVTVQEWISVKDRLPAVGEDVLVITSSSDRNMAVWRLFGNAENRQAHWENEVGDGLVLGAATHWMLLPQPPKGE